MYTYDKHVHMCQAHAHMLVMPVSWAWRVKGSTSKQRDNRREAVGGGGVHEPRCDVRVIRHEVIAREVHVVNPHIRHPPVLLMQWAWRRDEKGKREDEHGAH